MKVLTTESASLFTCPQAKIWTRGKLEPSKQGGTLRKNCVSVYWVEPAALRRISTSSWPAHNWWEVCSQGHHFFFLGGFLGFLTVDHSLTPLINMWIKTSLFDDQVIHKQCCQSDCHQNKIPVSTADCFFLFFFSCHLTSRPVLQWWSKKETNKPALLSGSFNS